MTGPTWLPIAAVASAVAAFIALVLQRRWISADAYLRISQQFETDRFRDYRSAIYKLDRDRFKYWSNEEKAAVLALGAHLDLVAVLIQAAQLNKRAFFNMYGDVALRTIYQIAPYCNHQIKERGGQFLLPIRMFTTDLVKFWRKQSRKKRYPETIKLPSDPPVELYPRLFSSDQDIVKFKIRKIHFPAIRRVFEIPDSDDC